MCFICRILLIRVGTRRLPLGAQQRRNMHLGAKALCLGNVRFESASGARLSSTKALLANPLSLTKCWLKFSTQKNGENGEEKLFSRHDNETGMCFVSAMLRIIRRFARLRGTADFTTPLSLYREETLKGQPPARPVNYLARHRATHARDNGSGVPP
jgi:hypothetical protein